MSNAQHTPGRSPWTLTEGGLILDADRNLVATVATGPHGEEEANAPLLTAAPELLAALNALLECPDVNHDALDIFSVQAVEQARDAIRQGQTRHLVHPQPRRATTRPLASCQGPFVRPLSTTPAIHTSTGTITSSGLRSSYMSRAIIVVAPMK